LISDFIINPENYESTDIHTHIKSLYQLVTVY